MSAVKKNATKVTVSKVYLRKKKLIFFPFKVAILVGEVITITSGIIFS
jgi:hypothetical protein